MDSIGLYPIERGDVSKQSYESPTVTVLGEVSDVTQSKPGFYFDYGNAAEGQSTKPAYGSPGTGTS